MSMQSALCEVNYPLSDRQYRCVSASMTIPISHLSLYRRLFVLFVCQSTWCGGLQKRENIEHILSSSVLLKPKWGWFLQETLRLTNKCIQVGSKIANFSSAQRLTIIETTTSETKRDSKDRQDVFEHVIRLESIPHWADPCLLVIFWEAKLQSWSQRGLQYCTHRENNAPQTVILDCHRNEHHCNVLWTLWRCWRCIAKRSTNRTVKCRHPVQKTARMAHYCTHCQSPDVPSVALPRLQSLLG